MMIDDDDDDDDYAIGCAVGRPGIKPAAIGCAGVRPEIKRSRSGCDQFSQSVSQSVRETQIRASPENIMNVVSPKPSSHRVFHGSIRLPALEDARFGLFG